MRPSISVSSPPENLAVFKNGEAHTVQLSREHDDATATVTVESEIVNEVACPKEKPPSVSGGPGQEAWDYQVGTARKV